MGRYISIYEVQQIKVVGQAGHGRVGPVWCRVGSGVGWECDEQKSRASEGLEWIWNQKAEW